MKRRQNTIDHRFKMRGHSWRVQSDDRGRFDEIAVVVGREPKAKQDGGLILHAEMMDDRSCCVCVAGVTLWVHVGRDGVARITDAEDRRGSQSITLRLALCSRGTK